MDRKSLSFSSAAVLLSLLLLLLGSGCASRQTKPPQTTSYYTLEYEPPVFSGLPVLDSTLRVVPFDAAPEYDTDRMVYRTGEYTLASYPYHSWIAKPVDLVHFFLERDLQRSGLLGAVLSDSSRLLPDYLLGGTVQKFLEVDEGDHWKAELSLSIILQRRPRGGGIAKILGQRHFTVQKVCSRKNPQAVAEAMSQAMAELSKQVQQDLYGLIKKDLIQQTGG